MTTCPLIELTVHPLNVEIYGDTYDNDLIESIKLHGILNPLVITKNKTIISGHRRYNVATEIGLSTVPVTITKIENELDLQEMIITYNTQRDKNREQRAREYKVIADIEKKRANERQGERTDLKKDNIVENFPQALNKKCVKNVPPNIPLHHMPPTTGKSRDISAKKVGWSGKTAEKAAKVVEVIDQLKEEGETEHAEEITHALNTKSVMSAFNKVKPIINVPKPNKQSVSKFNPTNDNIEWAQWTWNPITGCEHGCKYCYARDIAVRYYDHKFKPHFYENRLGAPHNTTIPKNNNQPGIKNVFVCSMSDIMGEFIPEKWINAIIDSMHKNPQWTYILLTKNPNRYIDFKDKLSKSNIWLGATTDTQKRMDIAIKAFTKLGKIKGKRFLSCEPLEEDIIVTNKKLPVEWVIVGGRSKSTQAPAFQPQWEWVENILRIAREFEIPIYFKPNLTIRPKEY